MNKISVKKQGTAKYLIIKMKRGQELNTRELELLSKRTYRQLIPVQIEHNKLVYNISALTTLEDIVTNNISVEGFFLIIMRIMDLLKTTQEAYLYGKNIILESQYIFVSPQGGELQVIYCPIINYDHHVFIKQFFIDLIHKVHLRNGQDSMKIAQFESFLMSMTTFSLYETEKFVHRISNVGPVRVTKRTVDTGSVPTGDVGKKTCKNCGYINNPGAKFCCNCGMSLQNVSQQQNTNMNMRTYVPTTNQYFQPRPQNTQQEEFEGTSVLGAEDFQGTTVLSAEQLSNNSPAYLLRITTGERVNINRPVFRLGKDRKTSEYCISDNKAISREHAEIINKNGFYYIKDKRSTNGTYLDGMILSAEGEYELSSGQRIKLANEEFEFGIDGR